MGYSTHNDEARRFGMPEAKKEPRANVSKVKIAKGRSVSTVRKGFADKPKASPVKAPKAIKPEVKAVAKAVVRKARSPQKAKGSFADLIKKQAELEEVKKEAKAELKKQYDSLLKEAESIKGQYKGLFDESIESAPKPRGGRARKAGGRVPGVVPFTLEEVKSFVGQKEAGMDKIKIQHRRPKSVARMEDAYRRSEDAEEILRILNK
jgi:hypothetical protein